MTKATKRRGLHPEQHEVLLRLYERHPRYRQRVERLLLKMPQRHYIPGDVMREWLTDPNHINPVERLETLRRLPLASASELYPYVGTQLGEYLPPFLTRPEQIDKRRFMLHPPEEFKPEQVARMRAGKAMEDAILTLDGGNLPDPKLIQKVRQSKPIFGLAGTPDWARHEKGTYIIRDAKFQTTHKPSGKAQAYYACQLHCYRILLLHGLGVPEKDWHSVPVRLFLDRRYAPDLSTETLQDYGRQSAYSFEERIAILKEISTAHSVEVEYQPRMTEEILNAASGIASRIRSGWPLGEAPLAEIGQGAKQREAPLTSKPADVRPDLVAECLFGGGL